MGKIILVDDCSSEETAAWLAGYRDRHGDVHLVRNAENLGFTRAVTAGVRLRPLWQQVAELERVAIARALEASGGNKQAAARLLGISRAKLYAGLVSEKATNV